MEQYRSLAEDHVCRDMESILSMPLMNGIFLRSEELPEEERYDGYLQLENGVGMLRLLDAEVQAGSCGKRWR